jgi:putative ABC transport system permease protein
MNPRKLLLRSLRYYRKTHLWVILGVMISTAVLVGALITGDSVRYSLRQIVFERLGKIEFALTSGERFFEIKRADDLSRILGTETVPLLQTRGIAAAGGGKRRINSIQVIGVDARFGALGGGKEIFSQIGSDEAFVNRRLAERLGINEDEEILVRMRRLDALPKDAPLSLDSGSTLARRFSVKKIVADSEFGKFNLRADQVTPSTVFVSLSQLSKDMGIEGKANTLVIAERDNNPLDIQTVRNTFAEIWSLADAGLELREIHDGKTIELLSNRIFLDPPVVDASLNFDRTAQPVLTYFVNEIRREERSTPYSFVSAPGSPIVPSEMKDDEIIINEWLARDLNAGIGDQIGLTYYVLGSKRELVESSSNFRVKAVVPLTGIYADRDLLPDFPGLSGQENCRDWDPGIPIDLEKIRDEDEKYWDDYRGTPKAFLTLSTAQKLWANRFGDLTSIRFTGKTKEGIQSLFRADVDPSSLGFVFREIKREGLQASSQSVNFSQLFLGLSFFIIAAALLLTSLLFVFNTENRSEETGLFLALGFSKKAVIKLILREAAVLVAAGSFLGIFLGAFYNLIILKALQTVWQGAVGTSALQIHLRFPSLLTGMVIGAITAFFTIWYVTRRQIKKTVTELQKGQTKIDAVRGERLWKSQVVGVFCMIAVLIILFTADFGKGEAAFAFFFAAGSLFLIGGMSLTNALFAHHGKSRRSHRMNLFRIGFRSNTRNRLRSISLIGLLACGLFIVFTVGANRINALRDAERRDSGTGGFSLFGESSIPVLYDLNSQKGRQFYRLDEINPEAVSFVQFRVREGDDASCLNLNRVSNPRLIGVDPHELAKRGAFTFVATADEVDPDDPWMFLERNLPDGSIPAVADQSVIVWGLGKSVGDTMTYVDERGDTFEIRLVGGLANSIFQGNIILSEKILIEKYPSISGYGLFLVDTPSHEMQDVSNTMSWAMQDQGLDLISASSRLEEFNTVQNTYLSIFLILGSLGLLLGSIGLGIVVWRHVKERRGELALLRAVGFTKRSIQGILLSEHLVLLAAGILYGIFAALLATLPSLLIPGADIPFLTMLFLLVIVGLNGFIWTTLAASLAVKEDLIPALRKE